MQIKNIFFQSPVLFVITLSSAFCSIQSWAANQCIEIYKTNSFLRSVVPFHDEMAVNADYYKHQDPILWSQLVSNLNASHRRLEQQVIERGLAEMGLSGRIGEVKVISAKELELIVNKAPVSSMAAQNVNKKNIYFVDGALDSLLATRRVQLLERLRSHIGENSILVISSHVHAHKKEDVVEDLKFYRQSQFVEFLEKPLIELGIRQYGEIEIHWDDIQHSYQARYTLTHNIPQALNGLKLMVGDSVILFQSHYFDRDKTQHIYRQSGFKNFHVVHNPQSRIAFIFAETAMRP